MFNFSTLSMLEILTILQEQLAQLNANDTIKFQTINPDIVDGIYSGNTLEIDKESYIYYSYKSWSDLANILKCKMLTPIAIDTNFVQIRYKKLHQDKSFHSSQDSIEVKYGQDSIFSQIQKMQEPAFLHYYVQALKNVTINKRTRILNLGVNSGDEFEMIQKVSSNFENLELVGIDYCPSAIETAKEKFHHFSNVQFFTHDINNLNALDLGRFDLIISIGTLQSSNLEFNPLFMSLVQNQLKNDGAIILGFPNCRWIDGELIYGARVKNYPFSEMSLVYKDVIFCKKYLQQKKFRVTITGKEYIFLTATSIRKEG